MAAPALLFRRTGNGSAANNGRVCLSNFFFTFYTVYFQFCWISPETGRLLLPRFPNSEQICFPVFLPSLILVLGSLKFDIPNVTLIFVAIFLMKQRNKVLCSFTLNFRLFSEKTEVDCVQFDRNGRDSMARFFSFHE